MKPKVFKYVVSNGKTYQRQVDGGTFRKKVKKVKNQCRENLQKMLPFGKTALPLDTIDYKLLAPMLELLNTCQEAHGRLISWIIKYFVMPQQ